MARLAAVESRRASHRRQMRPPRDPRDRPASPKSPPAGARAPLSERRRAHVCPRLSIPNSSQVLVAQKVAVGVYKGVTTSELDELAAETAASMTSKHPDYAQVSFHARMTHRARRTRAFTGAVSQRSRRLFSVFPPLSTRKTSSTTLRRSPPDADRPAAPIAARRAHRRVQPPQEHPQVVLGDVSAPTRPHAPVPARLPTRTFRPSRNDSRLFFSNLPGFEIPNRDTRRVTTTLTAAISPERSQHEGHVRARQQAQRQVVPAARR